MSANASGSDQNPYTYYDDKPFEAPKIRLAVTPEDALDVWEMLKVIDECLTSGDLDTIRCLTRSVGRLIVLAHTGHQSVGAALIGYARDMRNTKDLDGELAEILEAGL